MGGGNFTMRALMFLSVPSFLNTPERLLFGAGYMSASPSAYGPIAPWIYSFNYASSDYRAQGLYTKNVGWAAQNPDDVPIFFGDNGWAAIFASMGLFGLIFYFVFIFKILSFSYIGFSKSTNNLTKAIMIGLFCEILFNPIYSFFSAGYLSPPSAMHLTFFLAVASIAYYYSVTAYEKKQ